MTLAELQEAVDEWIKKYGVRYFDIKTNMLVLNEEVGEMSRIVARKYGEQSTKENEVLDMEDEIADVLWVLACIANQLDIDLTTAIEKNFEKKTNRDKDRHINNIKLKK